MPTRPDRPLPRTALVLGGDSDIAAATLRLLADEGLERVVLAVREVDAPGPDLPAGLRVARVRWDASEPECHAPMVAAALAELGDIDLVLCAVGLLGHHAGASMAADDVSTMLVTNTVGPAAALSLLAPHLVGRGGGTIVVLSSVAGVRPRRSNFVYGASKSGLDAFARGLGDAVVDSGVDVVVVRPGFVRSSMTAGLEPAPFATDPSVVASAICGRLARGAAPVVWVPPLLGPLFGVLSMAPARMWRRIAGDR